MFIESDVWDFLPNIDAFKNELYQLRNIEKYNAIKADKLHKHMKKWQNVSLNPSVGNVISYQFINDSIENISIRCMLCPFDYLNTMYV